MSFSPFFYRCNLEIALLFLRLCFSNRQKTHVSCTRRILKTHSSIWRMQRGVKLKYYVDLQAMRRDDCSVRMKCSGGNECVCCGLRTMLADGFAHGEQSAPAIRRPQRAFFGSRDHAKGHRAQQAIFRRRAYHPSRMDTKKRTPDGGRSLVRARNCAS